MVPEESPDAPQACNAKQHAREVAPGVHELGRRHPGNTWAGAAAAQRAALLSVHVSTLPRRTVSIRAADVNVLDTADGYRCRIG